MSYGSENYTSSSSYRKIFGDSPRHTSSLSRPAMSSSRVEWSWHNDSSSGLSSKRSSRYIPLDLSFDMAPSSALDDFKIVRTNEKVQLQDLNDRFATFIEKVHNLEQQNKLIMIASDTIQQQTGPSRLVELHEQRFLELRSQLDQLNREKSQLIIDNDRMQDKLQKFEEKYKQEFDARECAEFNLAEFRKDVDYATMVRMDLENKVESLQVEIDFLKKEREEEVGELMVKIENFNVSMGTMEMSKLDLSSALKDIRVQYESIASNNLQSTVEWYENKIAEQARQSTSDKRASEEKMNESWRQLQSKIDEIESLRGTNKSLEKQLHEMEERHRREMLNHQNDMVKVEKDMRDVQSSITRHVREYQDLLNVKMALDIEIAAYRKLLEGEEKRIDKGINISGVQGYYRSHSYTSSSRGSMKEGKNEDPQQSMSGGKTEVTVVTTTSTTTDNLSDIPINQNN